MLQLPKPTHLEPVLHSKRSHCHQKPADRSQSGPCALPAEKAHLAKKSRCNQKVKHFKKEAGTKIRLVIAKGEGGRGGREMYRESQIGRYTLLHLGWINKALLYNVGKYIQSPGISYKGK